MHPGDAVINATASANNNTIVVLHIPGATIFGSWINNPNVTAIIAPMLPGEQTGPSLVSLLWGDVSPSGKLPFTRKPRLCRAWPVVKLRS